jgi:DNA uptake protein ComE-like DNA-binding protein
MNFKRFVQDYFTFSRNERKGITILLILIFLLGIANKVIFYFEKPVRIDINLLDSASNKLGVVSDSINLRTLSQKLFRFNPNTIDSVALDSLNLPIAVKSNLLKFRNRSGKFYSAADFKRIYGVTDSLYTRVEPYLFVESNTTAKPAVSERPDLFMFDPNKATNRDFQRLGLSDKQITTIRNYLGKGGSFRSKDDFFKIYGISDHQKEILSNYILIRENLKVVEKNIETVNSAKIEINSADSITLEQLPEIGEKLSKRIVKYRDILGGFYSFDQLKEVYGLNEQTIKVIEGLMTIDASKIRKLDLNFSDLKELSKHPYIRKNLAEKIIKFRSAHGSIADLTILYDNMILNIDEYNRLQPYF